jgi:propionyl-CoA carboxylase alpha chain
VAEGDVVAQGQPLVVLEAMKMANELRSPIAGRVSSLRAVEGQPVEGGVTLVIVES